MNKVADAVPTFWRYWLMLSLLPTSPRRVSCTAIRDHLAENGVEVDVRSIQRDLLKLSAYFPIAHDDKRPRGWSFSAQAKRFDLPGMDAHLALTFELVKTYLAPQLPPATLRALEGHFQQAAQVLRGKQRRGVPSWTRKLYVASRLQPLQAPKVSSDVLRAVYDALLDDHVVTLTYSGRDAARRMVDAEAHPHGLIFRESVAYLVCTLWHYDDVRMLALHRIEAATRQRTRRRVLPDFDLAAFAKAGAPGWREGEEPIGVVLRFSKEAALAVMETPLSEDQRVKVLDDGRVEVSARVPDTRVFQAWVRSFGAAVEVVKPKRLRRRMIEEVGALRGMYEV